MNVGSELGVWLYKSFSEVCDDVVVVVHHDAERLADNQRRPHDDVPPLWSVPCLYAAANDRQWNLIINNTFRVTVKVLWKGSSNLTYLNFRHFISPSGLPRFGFNWFDFFRGDLIGFGVDFIHYIRHLVGIIVERQ